MLDIKSAAEQLAGSIEKAIIEIDDKRGRKPVVSPPVAPGRKPVMSPPVDFMDGLSKAMDLAESDAASLAWGAAQTVSGTAQLRAEPAVDAKKRFYVQFNPSELSLSGHGGSLQTKTDYADGGGISFDSVGVCITLDVKLVFDKVDSQDAFLSDKMSLAPTTSAVGAAKAIKTGMGKKDVSVQTEVEGFLAALRSPHTRRIAFHWGKLFYTGILNRVVAEYTMFNADGQPIRASVALSLICADENVLPGRMGSWQTQYQKAFQGKDQSYVKTAQKVGSLLNFDS